MSPRAATARTEASTTEPSAEGKALDRQLSRAEHLLRALDARECLRVVGEALRQARRLGDFRAQARAYAIATGCHYYRGDYVSAVATGLDACIASPESDRAGRSHALQGVALAFVSAGDFARAEKAARRALREADEAGDPSCAANARNVLGFALAERGRYDESLRLFRRAREIFRRLGDAERVSATAVNTGHALCRSAQSLEKEGERAAAVRRWRRARSFYRTALGSGRPRISEIMARASIADCELHLGQDAAALALLLDADRLLRPADPPLVAARVACLVGEAERRSGNFPEAWRHLRLALAGADSIAGDELASECREALSRLSADCGLATQAREWKDEARSERLARRRKLAAFRQQMRPLWERYVRLDPD